MCPAIPLLAGPSPSSPNAPPLLKKLTGCNGYNLEPTLRNLKALESLDMGRYNEHAAIEALRSAKIQLKHLAVGTSGKDMGCFLPLFAYIKDAKVASFALRHLPCYRLGTRQTINQYDALVKIVMPSVTTLHLDELHPSAVHVFSACFPELQSLEVDRAVDGFHLISPRAFPKLTRLILNDGADCGQFPLFWPGVTTLGVPRIRQPDLLAVSFPNARIVETGLRSTVTLSHNAFFARHVEVATSMRARALKTLDVTLNGLAGRSLFTGIRLGHTAERLYEADAQLRYAFELILAVIETGGTLSDLRKLEHLPDPYVKTYASAMRAYCRDQ